MKLPNFYSIYNPMSNIIWLCSHEQQTWTEPALHASLVPVCFYKITQIRTFSQVGFIPKITATVGRKKWTTALKIRNHGHVLIKLHQNSHPSHEESMFGCCLVFQELLCCSFGRPWKNPQQKKETKDNEKALLKWSMPTIPYYLFKVHKGITPTWKKTKPTYTSLNIHTLFTDTQISLHIDKSLWIW